MAITVVQAAPTVTVSALTGPLTATLPGSTTAGNTLVALVTTHGSTTDPAVSTITIGGVADNWQAAHTDPGAVHFGGAIWYDPNCVGGQTSVVLNVTGGVGASLPALYLAVYEISGALVFDQGSHGDDATGTATTWTSNATATTAWANEIFIAAAMGSASLPTVTGVGTWNTQSTVTGNFDQISGTQIVAATGTATFSGTQTAGFYIALVATFYQASAIATSSAYATSAADLGDGSGSWANPSNATGVADTTYAVWTAL